MTDQVRILLRSPEIVARTSRAARERDPLIADEDVRSALHRFEEVWGELFPAEQARVVQLLVERVDVREQGIAITLRTEGLGGLVQELRAADTTREAA